MNKHPTEQAYDDLMNPLIAKLIAIAKAAGVPLFIHAGMLSDEGDSLGCITWVPAETDNEELGEWNRRHAGCRSACMRPTGEPPFTMMMIGGGS